MINFYDESGARIVSGPELRKAAGYQVGAQVARVTDTFGARYFLPFSSFHRYERADSVWANEATTALSDFAVGYESKSSEILPAFVRYDCVTQNLEPLHPVERAPLVVSPETFGDTWSDELTADEARRVSQYFDAITHLADFIGFVNVRVGGRDNITRLSQGGYAARGITFDVPRTSLLKAVEWQIFDDLLIGNFMRTTLHGKWPAAKLSLDVTPYVAKYADNGQARTKEELSEYFHEYRRRLGPVRSLRHLLERNAKQTVQRRFGTNSSGYELASRAYQRVAQRT
jgi:hypothetical protein